MDIITSSSNQRVKDWKKLSQKKARIKQGKYMLDGWHLVKEAILFDQSISEILVTQDFKHRNELEVPDNVEVIEISDKVAKHLSETPSPQGIFAVVNLPENAEEKPEKATGAWLFLDGVQDPGNIGTMVRTADACGFSGVVFGEGCADMFQPKVVRAMQGSQFHLKLCSGNLIEWAKEFKQRKLPVFGSELNDQARSYDQVGRHSDFALVMGNEGNGMSEKLLKETSLNLYIPIKGHAESLNVAVAAGILMFGLME